MNSFPSAVDPRQAARARYLEETVLNARREEVPLLLFDGAISFLNQAKSAMEEKRYDLVSDRIGRAQAILMELNLSLNMEEGGEIALNLRRIYNFLRRHTTQALINQQPTMLEQAIRIISTVREGWAEAAQQYLKAETQAQAAQVDGGSAAL